MSYKFLLFTLILSPMVYGKQMSIPVVTIVPVANLATEPSSKRFPNDPNPYDKLGTTYKSGIDSCPRLHQLLFNEQVRIIEQNGNDVLIEVPYLYFKPLLKDIKSIGTGPISDTSALLKLSHNLNPVSQSQSILINSPPIIII